MGGRLLRGREHLTERQFTRMWNDLIDGDPTGQILTAWIAKEELRALLALAKTGGQRHQITNRLFRFYLWCADSTIPELERLAGTIDAWWPEVLAFLRTGITNAGTEATNRTVKSAARHRLRLPQPQQPTTTSTLRLVQAGRSVVQVAADLGIS